MLSNNLPDHVIIERQEPFKLQLINGYREVVSFQTSTMIIVMVWQIETEYQYSVMP